MNLFMLFHLHMFKWLYSAFMYFPSTDENVIIHDPFIVVLFFFFQFKFCLFPLLKILKVKNLTLYLI